MRRTSSPRPACSPDPCTRTSPGFDTFAGPVHHSARWPHDGVDLAGKRVGLLGVGASGIQMLPELAAVAEHVTVFQRTPNYVLETTSP